MPTSLAGARRLAHGITSGAMAIDAQIRTALVVNAMRGGKAQKYLGHPSNVQCELARDPPSLTPSGVFSLRGGTSRELRSGRGYVQKLKE